MVKIDAIVREDKMEDVKDALQNLNVHGMTISQVMGCGTNLGYKQNVRGSIVDVNMVPKVKFEVVVSTREWAESTADAIAKAAYTGEHGDGKIFMYELMDTIRIRTRERGPEALWDTEQKNSASRAMMDAEKIVVAEEEAKKAEEAENAEE